ncbi:hypothetical protein MmiHf6_14920 [Methanimicrococcus hongohii]|uniref:Uncharacterized protein n=1 Tax=Methanimicrococcus hongohii TaxID=3028295 RepID=A0AA96V1I7_9EURY|nr:hypothetical protein [Methanimicrococcus sp. Hf6]WNY24163.1 hypothetical protein MmiHf6_14920 [Methanimicrococcus sp. Hf6]
MAGLFNQSEKMNNLLFVGLLGAAVLSYILFISILFYTNSLTVYYLQVITLILIIFGPAVFSLISQNFKKSLLLAFLIPVVIFVPFNSYLLFLDSVWPFPKVVIFTPPENDLMAYGKIILQYAAFAVGGAVSVWLAQSYQPENEEKEGKQKYLNLFYYGLILFLIVYVILVMFSGFYR